MGNTQDKSEIRKQKVQLDSRFAEQWLNRKTQWYLGFNSKTNQTIISDGDLSLCVTRVLWGDVTMERIEGDARKYLPGPTPMLSFECIFGGILFCEPGKKVDLAQFQCSCTDGCRSLSKHYNSLTALHNCKVVLVEPVYRPPPVRLPAIKSS